MDRDEKLRRLTEYARRVAPESRVESLIETPAALESLTVSETAQREVREGLESVATGRRPTPAQERALEAIVLPDLRPAALIQGGTYRLTHRLWLHLNADAVRSQLETVIRSIGRVEVPDHPTLPYAGTGFVVGEGLLMTNRHVAEIFARGLGRRGLVFAPGRTAGIDFLREHPAAPAAPQPTLFLRVNRVEMIHPYWDMALLRVDGLPPAQAQLTLATVPPEGLVGRQVVVIGYPARDPRNDSRVQDDVFDSLYSVKRLQPGLARERKPVGSYGNRVSALTHDCSTLGGNSGSAVVDVETGQVVGLHFAGEYLLENYAVPAYALAADPRVVEAGVRFGGSVPPIPDMAVYWDQVENAAAQTSVGSTTLPVPPGAVSFVLPLQVTVSLLPVVTSPPQTPPTVSAAVPPAPQVYTPPPPLTSGGDTDPYAAGRKEFERSRERMYFDEARDRQERESYYAGLASDLSGDELTRQLADLVQRTHSRTPSYAPSRQLYPWVDLHPDLRLKSVYSGQTFDPLELISLDEQVERLRAERLEEFRTSESFAGPEALAAQQELIEAALPYNCEHVVPQSWFGKREPMRGDLHHLFTCESGCNSFRGNTPYFNFPPVEAVRQGCGRREGDRFEPTAGKGAVARATLYFLLRYPGKVRASDRRVLAERLATLLAWHKDETISVHEKHRNQAIAEIQGNRNPLIDHPEWAERLSWEATFT